jgi:aspartate/methionine/tyrosine aminotransferase
MLLKTTSTQEQRRRIELRTGTAYADLIANQRLFAELVGPRLGIDCDYVVPTNGATGVIEAVRNHVLKNSRQRAPVVLTVCPGYWRARESFHGLGFQVISMSTLEQGFAIEEPRLVEEAKKVKPELIYLSLPNNPTGAIFDPEIIIESVGEDVTIMIDLTLPSRELDSMALVNRLHRRFKGRKALFFACSTSKSHETAEYRVGWAVCTSAEDAQALMNENRNSVSTFSLVEGARHIKEPPTVLEKIDESFSFLEKGAKAQVFEIVRPAPSVRSSYLLVRLLDKSRDYRQLLAENGIEVMWGADFGLTDEYIRLELTESASIRIFVEAINGSCQRTL